MTQSVNFDQASAYYDQTRSFPPGVEAAVAALMAQAGGLTAADTLLEIGVGTGRIALPLVPHVGQMMGIDISTQMMQQLRGKPGAERIALAQADALRLPFAAQCFDAGIIVHVLHLVADPAIVLQEMARILKPGGRLLHCNNRFPDGGQIELLARTWGDTSSSGRVTQRYARIDALLNELNWQRQAQHAYRYTRHTTPRAYIDHIEKRVWSSTWGMSDAEIKSIVQRLHAVVAVEFGGDLDATITVESAFDIHVFAPPLQ